MAESRVSERRQVAVKEKAAQEVKALTGNRAAAMAAKLARVGVGMFYPIGPADEVMEMFRELITQGEAPGAEVLQLENEKAIVAAQISIAQQGIRTMFATCGVGLTWAGAQIKEADRVPIMIVVPSRSLALTVSADYEDYIMQRDMGCLMFYCENAQDALDTILQSYKVAEDADVRLPVIVGYDGWEVSHSTYRCSVPSQEDIDSFLPRPVLHPDDDMLAVDWHSWTKTRRDRAKDPGIIHEEHYKRRLATERAKELIEEVGQEYQQLFGRDYVGLVESYRNDDAEVVLITMGQSTTTARMVADALRERGDRVGVVKLRAFRPFPGEVLADAVKGAKVVAVVERDPTDAVFTEVKAAVCGAERHPLVMGRVVGLGGRDISYYDIIEIANEGLAAARSGRVTKEIDYLIRGKRG